MTTLKTLEELTLDAINATALVERLEGVVAHPETLRQYFNETMQACANFPPVGAAKRNDATRALLKLSALCAIMAERLESKP